MKIFFYNMNHIGDIYIFAALFNILCEINESIEFSYFAIQGDIFFNTRLQNLKKIGNIYTKYNNPFINGNPPEDLLNNDILTVLINNNMASSQLKCLKIDGEDRLCINTWASAPIIKHIDFHLYDAIRGWNSIINEINLRYKINLNFEIQNKTHLFNNVSMPLQQYDNTSIDNDTIFIFNYKPRSIHYNMNSLYKMTVELSKTNKIMLSCYDKDLSNYNNIEFFDRKYNITPEPSCFNLIKLWNIIINCKKIYITPTGSNWTFIHILNKIKTNQVYMINSGRYTDILNKNINWLLDNNINLVNNINI
jgi:hypothetical protein